MLLLRILILQCVQKLAMMTRDAPGLFLNVFAWFESLSLICVLVFQNQRLKLEKVKMRRKTDSEKEVKIRSIIFLARTRKNSDMASYSGFARFLDQIRSGPLLILN